MKDWFNNNILTHKKRYIVIGIAFLIVLISSSVIYFSYAFYQSKSSKLVVTGSANINTSDIRLRVYLQQNGKYVETKGDIPSNYIYNPAKSNCSEGLYIDEVNKNNFTIAAEKKGTCSVYLDEVKTDADITTRLYILSDTGYQYVDTLPTDKKYFINTKLSDCNGNAEVLADGTIAAKGIATCTVVYGELTLASYITNNVYNSQTNQASITAATPGAGLYKHDATLINGAQDNSYRYAGADADVNNWVCFDGDDCADENNLYRIISVDSNNVTKIIKATSLDGMVWNNKTGYTATGSTEDIAMGLTSGTVYRNIWAIKQADGSYYTSSLNDYLNGEYLTSLGTKASKVERTIWNVGGTTDEIMKNKNVHDFMTYEIDTATDDTNKGTYEAKVGLMYAYEYGYAALPEFWTLNLNNSDSTKGYQASLGKDWMFSTSYKWTISRRSDGSGNVFRVHTSEGSVNISGVIAAGAVHPVLGLSSSVKLINAELEGIGTKTNPIIIK